MLIAAWVVVPLLADRAFTIQDEFSRNKVFYDSFGARKILGWLVTGELFDRDLQEVIQEENKEFLSEEFVKLGIEVFPSYANFMLARFPPGILNDNNGRKGVWTRLTERGLYLRNKSVMYPRTDICHDMVRITIPNRETCEKLVNELKQLMGELVTPRVK